MGADKVVQTADRTLEVNGPLVAAIAPEHRFWFGLAFAAALHAALIFGVTRSSPRQIGERSGRPDGISVVLVDEADLRSKNTFREDGASAAPPAIAQPPAPAAPPQPKTESEPPVPKQSPAPKVEAAPPAPWPREEQKSAAQAIDKEILDSLAAPGPVPKQSEPASAAKIPPKPEQPQQKPPLQLTMPNIPVAPGGRAAAVARPPGATRSGENDEFGRGVIRALRQTMPSPNGQLGRVTVKLLLSHNGNLAEVQLIRSAGILGLDQSVVFAVKQASFPIPPGGATLVDRTFLVTYIYN
jgi:protein TonB